MVDGFHILIWNRIKKPLENALSGAGRGYNGRDSGGNLTNVQCKTLWNCHNECPLQNEYILIKEHTKKLKDFATGHSGIDL
jgi:hypothetical protein